MKDAALQRLSDRIAAIEVMVEMLASESMVRNGADQSLDDYGEVAAMILERRHTEGDMDGVLSVLGERLAKVREHVEVVRDLQRRERMQ